MASANDYAAIYQEAGKAFNVDPNLLRAVVHVESGGNPNAVSEVGAQGPAQLMPATAKSLGVKNAFDPRENIFGAAKLLDENLTRYGNANDAILAYHGGTDQKNWGPKTRDYLGKVTSAYQGNQGTKMPSTMNTLGEMNAPDAFSSYFSGETKAAPKQTDAFTAYFGSPGEAKVVQTQAIARPQQQAPVPQGSTPSAATMGAGDIVRGGVQSLVHGIGALAERYPNAAKALNFLTGGDINADVAGDFQRGTKQVDALVAQQERDYAAQRAAQGETGIDWKRLGGNLVGGAPLAAALPGGAATLAGRVGLGAMGGAAGALAAPVTDESAPFAEQKAKQMALGAALGGAAPVVTNAVGAAVRGVTDPIRQRLAQAGVTMTPGQILGGALQRAEDKLTGVPVLGDFIKNAQGRSVDSFNRSTYNNALGEIGQSIPDNVSTGSSAVKYVKDKIGDVYRSIQPRASFVSDQPFQAELTAIRNDLAQNSPASLTQFDNIVENQISKKLSNGAMTGEQWGNTRSSIAKIARDRVTGNASPDDRVLSSALDDLGDAVNNAVGRASPADVLPTLGNANSAWARYKQIERAAGSVNASNNENVFTAAQFANAVRKQATQSQKATNSGLSGQLASDATAVLGSKYPDSGTIGRGLLTGVLATGAGQTFAPSVAIPMATAVGVGSLPYTQMGQRLAQALLLNRPAGAGVAANLIQQAGPRLGALLAPAALNQGGGR